MYYYFLVPIPLKYIHAQSTLPGFPLVNWDPRHYKSWLAISFVLYPRSVSFILFSPWPQCQISQASLVMVQVITLWGARWGRTARLVLRIIPLAQSSASWRTVILASPASMSVQRVASTTSRRALHPGKVLPQVITVIVSILRNIHCNILSFTGRCCWRLKECECCTERKWVIIVHVECFVLLLALEECVAPVQKLGAEFAQPRVALPSSDSGPRGYTESHSHHAKDLKFYQTKVYASHLGQFGSVQARLIVFAPGKVKPEVLFVISPSLCPLAFVHQYWH